MVNLASSALPNVLWLLQVSLVMVKLAFLALKFCSWLVVVKRDGFCPSIRGLADSAELGPWPRSFRGTYMGCGWMGLRRARHLPSRADLLNGVAGGCSSAIWVVWWGGHAFPRMLIAAVPWLSLSPPTRLTIPRTPAAVGVRG